MYCKKTNFDLYLTRNLFLQTIGDGEHLKPKFQGRIMYVQLKNTFKKS